MTSRDAFDVEPAGEVASGSRGLVDPGEPERGAFELARGLGLSITVADALHRRGTVPDDGARRWLDPKLVHLTPPDAMADRELSADRIARALKARETIAVFGDYDCDGVTSAAITTGILRALGGDVRPVLATRREGAYGLSHKALARVRETGASLLVTCDCGSSDHERLAVAKAAGIDCVVIDHHLVPPEPLPALAFLNPHRPDCGFAYKGLASCGLALSLGAAVRKKLGVAYDVRPWLDLVAIGTIADVAPLTGDNRALVRAGLQVLASGQRPGLRALFAMGRIDAGTTIDAEDVAYRVAPRINAPGRLADPDVALELLLSTNTTTAAALAATIEQRSQERRAIQDAMLAEAIAEIERAGFAKDPALVLAKEGWHPGVVGIVAGRLTTRYGKPSIVIGLEGATGRGSVRGPTGAKLHSALTRCRDALVGFGGHQAAAGLEVRAERVGALRDAFNQAFVDEPSFAGVARAIEADVRLDDRDDPFAVARDLERLEPCGEANRAPLVLLRDVPVQAARAIKGHLKLELAWKRRTIGAFGFDLGEHAPTFAGARVDVIGRLRRDAWRGGDAVEIRVERVARRG